jgi:hypothetical protein
VLWRSLDKRVGRGHTDASGDVSVEEFQNVSENKFLLCECRQPMLRRQHLHLRHACSTAYEFTCVTADSARMSLLQ